MATLSVAAIAAFLIALGAVDLGGHVAHASANVNVYVHYRESTETTYTEVIVAEGRVRVRTFEDATGKCARWIEQRPCWTEADLRLVESELAPAQRDDLIRLVEQGGFMDLGPSYGGAADGQRFYPIEIAVKLGDEERRIVYQAFPGASSMPDGFARLQTRLEALAQAVLDRDTPP